MKVVLTLIFIIVYCFPAFAERGSHSSKIFKMNLGVFLSSKRVYRGALIWDAPILGIGPSFRFFNILSVGEGGISLYKKLGNYHMIRVGYSYFDDNKPSDYVLKLSDKTEDHKNQRQSTYGTYLNYKFRYMHLFAFGITYHKDLKRHYGDYLHTKISTSIIPFVSLGVGTGYGDGESNKYAYGPEGRNGMAYYDSFVMVSLPFLPWRGRLMLNFKRTKITQKENQNADFVRGKHTNHTYGAFAMWNII